MLKNENALRKRSPQSICQILLFLHQNINKYYKGSQVLQGFQSKIQIGDIIISLFNNSQVKTKYISYCNFFNG